MTYPYIFCIEIGNAFFTAFLISKNGYVLTAGHPFPNGSVSKIFELKNENEKFKAELVYCKYDKKDKSDKSDFAILKIDSELVKLKPPPLSCTKNKENDAVYGYGYGSLVQSKNKHLSKFNGVVGFDDEKSIFTKGIERQILPGDSGAPVFDEKTNKIIGVVYQRNAQTIETTHDYSGYFIPLADIANQLKMNPIPGFDFEKICKKPVNILMIFVKVIIGLIFFISIMYIVYDLYHKSEPYQYSQAIQKDTLPEYKKFMSTFCGDSKKSFRCDSIFLRIEKKYFVNVTEYMDYKSCIKYKNAIGNFQKVYRNENCLYCATVDNMLMDTNVLIIGEWMDTTNVIIYSFYRDGMVQIENPDTSLKVFNNDYTWALKGDSLSIDLLFEKPLDIKKLTSDSLILGSKRKFKRLRL